MGSADKKLAEFTAQAGGVPRRRPPSGAMQLSADQHHLRSGRMDGVRRGRPRYPAALASTVPGLPGTVHEDIVGRTQRRAAFTAST